MSNFLRRRGSLFDGCHVPHALPEEVINPNTFEHQPEPSPATPSDACTDHSNQIMASPETLLDITIFECQSDTDETEDLITDCNFQKASSPNLGKLFSDNSTTALTSSRCPHNHQHSQHKKLDESTSGTYFKRFKKFATLAKNVHVATARSGWCQICVRDQTDYNHNIKQVYMRSVDLSIPTSCTTNFQRPFNVQNVKRKDIQFGEVIGKGGFGKVHAGNIRGHPVAIKVVQKRRGSGIHREILQAERLAFSLNLRHENIVSILALNLSDGLRGDALIVMELVSPLTLQSLLDDHSVSVTQSQRLMFALQITEALNYLHANEVAHLDVKPRNVLLTSDHTCKLADFGSLTRTRTGGPMEEIEFTQLLGTLPYRAPELMKGHYPSSKADIYSLGITLWQLATRQTPHDGANPHWLIYQVTKTNRRPDLHETGSDIIEIKYRDLYIMCWDAQPPFRPNAADIIMSLSTLLQSACGSAWLDIINRND